MEDKMYRSVDDNRYATRYEYSNLSSKEVEADQNYGDYQAEDAEYPIGDSQDIDQSALPGDYYAEDEYCNYSAPKGYLQPTRTAKAAVGGAQKYVAVDYRARGQLQSRPSAYYEVGDYRRAAIRDKLNYYKAEPKVYTQQAPEYSLSKVKRESLFRNLTEKEYRNRFQKMVKEDRMRQERYAAATAKYYGQETEEPMTHDELLENFKKNYKMDFRKPRQVPQTLKAQHLPAPIKVSNVKKPASPKSDTEALREHYDETYGRYYAGQDEKAPGQSGTKDTRSEPVQPDYSKFDKFLKSTKRRTYKEYSPRRPLTADDYAHEMLRSSVQKSHDLELKYKNDAYGKLAQEDTDVALQDINENGNQQSSVTSFSHLKSSDEKVVPPRKNVSKIRASLRSNRSKKSNNTGRSKKYEDIVKLQKSKCTIMSVIYDGIQKCEQAKYEVMPQFKAFRGENFLARATKESQTGQNDRSQDSCTSNEVMHSEIITNMFKEFRDYHLQNISQEVKRIQYLDVLPQKLTNLQGPQ